MKLLLLSNSTMPDEAYFQWPLPHVSQFLDQQVKKICFIPFAAVTFSYDTYTQKMRDALAPLGYEVEGIHTHADMKAAIRAAECIAVGGGNTFHLTKMLHDNGLVQEIRNVVKAGTPYMGWSAGSNVAGPSIKTTNDMPIVYPPSFEAVQLVPFQINPHFTTKTIDGHGGEPRQLRLEEFLAVNREAEVYAIPEGSFIEVSNNTARYNGEGLLHIMRFGQETEKHEPGYKWEIL